VLTDPEKQKIVTPQTAGYFFCHTASSRTAALANFFPCFLFSLFGLARGAHCEHQHNLPVMSMKAITIGAGHNPEIKDVPIPKVRPNRVLVQVKAVAINPADAKAIYWRELPGTRSGCDYVGIVKEVGAEVGKVYNVGDRIAGMVQGAYVSLFYFIPFFLPTRVSLYRILLSPPFPAPLSRLLLFRL
jgi:hypothetical protein